MNVDPAEVDHIDEDLLEYEPFSAETHAVRRFDCGQHSLNEFLNTEEVERYARESFGKTTLVFYRGTLVGYFTLGSGSLRVEKLRVKKGKVFFKSGELRLEAVPALMIGRFATAKAWKRKGIGTAMMRYIAGRAFAMEDEYAACRLLILNAKPNEESIQFYRGMGFAFTDDHAEKSRRNKTMFLDLHELKDVIDYPGE
jgi:GNAT superfamily N-acetyltransferase